MSSQASPTSGRAPGSPQHRMANHSPPTLLPPGGSRWSFRRFSHDSALGSLSQTLSESAPANSSKSQRKRSDPVMGHASSTPGSSGSKAEGATTPSLRKSRLSTSPSLVLSEPQNPINIITDYSPISTPPTPSPSVKSPRGSPRSGPQHQPSDTSAKGSSSSPKAATKRQRRASLSPDNTESKSTSNTRSGSPRSGSPRSGSSQTGSPRSPHHASSPGFSSTSDSSVLARVKKKLSMETSTPASPSKPKGRPRLSSPKTVPLKNSPGSAKTVQSSDGPSVEIPSKVKSRKRNLSTASSIDQDSETKISKKLKTNVVKTYPIRVRHNRLSLDSQLSSRSSTKSPTSSPEPQVTAFAASDLGKPTVKRSIKAKAKPILKKALKTTLHAKQRQSSVKLKAGRRALSIVGAVNTKRRGKKLLDKQEAQPLQNAEGEKVTLAERQKIRKKSVRKTSPKEDSVTTTPKLSNIETAFTIENNQASSEVKVRKKPGPKPKLKVDSPASIENSVSPTIASSGEGRAGSEVNVRKKPGPKPKLKLDSPASTPKGNCEPDTSRTELPVASETVKIRKKPGPKPKLKLDSPASTPKGNSEPDTSRTESPIASETVKIRKKPGPKPKVKLDSPAHTPKGNSEHDTSRNESPVASETVKIRKKPGPKPKVKLSSPAHTPKGNSEHDNSRTESPVANETVKVRKKPGPKPNAKPKVRSSKSPKCKPGTPVNEASNSTPQISPKSNGDTGGKPAKPALKKTKSKISPPQGLSIAKRKNAQLTIDVAQKLKSVAKKRVTLQAPIKTPRKRSSMMGPRSPRKSPRIILKDVIQLSKIEYENAMIKANKKSPSPVAKVKKSLNLQETELKDKTSPRAEQKAVSEKVAKQPQSTDPQSTDPPSTHQQSTQATLISISKEAKKPGSRPKVNVKTLKSVKGLKKKEPKKVMKTKKTDKTGKLKLERKPKVGGVKPKKTFTRPVSPDTSDDDVLYSLNPDYDGDDSESSESLALEIKPDLVAAASNLQVVSPRKLLLKDSIKPKTKLVKPVPRQNSPVSPAKAAAATVQEGANYKTPPSSPMQSRMRMQGESQCPEIYMSDLPTVPVMPQIPTSPSTASYKTLLDNLPSSLQPNRGAKRKDGGEDEGDAVERRVSVRNSESAFRYKEIIVKKCPGYTQIWLFTTGKMKNALNPKVLQELSQALHNAKFDDSRLVLLSGSGSIFCSGVDLNYLLSGDRRQSSQAMADALRDFVNIVIAFPKPIIAAVNGPAIGLGAAILPLCDIIYASDKASFYCPYGRLGQTPEACSSYTFPHVLGMAMANDMLLAGRKLTALEAYQMGLVSQVFWPTSMMQEVIPRVQNMSTQSIRSLEGSKLLIRSHQRGKMELTNESECRMLVDRWASGECQRAMRTYLDEEHDYML